MHLLKNFNIRTVMLTILGLFCLLWTAVGIHGVYSLNAIRHGNLVDRALVHQMIVLSKGNDQYFRFVTRLSRLMDMRAEGKVPSKQDEAGVQAALDGLARQLAAFKGGISGLMDPAITDELIQRWQVLLDAGTTPQWQLAQQGNYAQWRIQASQVTPPLSRAFGTSVDKYNTAAAALLDDTRVRVDQLTARIRNSIIAAIIFGLVILVFTDRYLVSMMVRPLDRLRDHFRLMAAGNLNRPVEEFGRNCVGRLIPLVRNMQDNLRDAVAAIRRGSENIDRGAREISAGNRDLSARTEQQAAALEQTAASMEQLTATVTLNAHHARQASDLAEHASHTADSGGRLVNDVITTMAGIAASSRKIADITSVINGIAFQTNILALNAAVEAARAGEQGRGFAVVASEVRNLAQRSAAAAKEIATLIDDSVQRVDSGSRLVNQAGDTMSGMMTSVTEVSQFMKQIAGASEEQSKGIAQVGSAVTEMDSVTQQNASLVQQIAAAASALALQTESLQQSVAHFQLSDSDNLFDLVAAN